MSKSEGKKQLPPPVDKIAETVRRVGRAGWRVWSGLGFGWSGPVWLGEDKEFGLDLCAVGVAKLALDNQLG